MDVAGLLIPSFKAGAAASGVLVEQRELDLIGLPYDWTLGLDVDHQRGVEGDLAGASNRTPLPYCFHS